MCVFPIFVLSRVCRRACRCARGHIIQAARPFCSGWGSGVGRRSCPGQCRSGCGREASARHGRSPPLPGPPKQHCTHLPARTTRPRGLLLVSSGAAASERADAPRPDTGGALRPPPRSPKWSRPPNRLSVPSPAPTAARAPFRRLLTPRLTIAGAVWNLDRRPNGPAPAGARLVVFCSCGFWRAHRRGE